MLFTAKGFQARTDQGRLEILQEGTTKKLVPKVDQITFSGSYARKHRQTVRYITERAVFELREQGLTLIEIAPGIDLQKDVLDQMEFAPIIAPDLKQMEEALFRP